MVSVVQEVDNVWYSECLESKIFQDVRNDRLRVRCSIEFRVLIKFSKRRVAVRGRDSSRPVEAPRDIT